ncbi:uncharacterized protein [Littorina saxatilis]|uniref:uncharacterized protein n=1 Tax=Littorina saxatilis TaxID=31220 RepID=UPI0038B49D4C
MTLAMTRTPWLRVCLCVSMVTTCVMAAANVYDELPEYKDHPCKRQCEDGAAPMKCRYTFVIEYYHTLTKACHQCPHNLTDCQRPHCVAGDGMRRGLMTVNRMLPGPALHVCEGDQLEVKVYNKLEGGEGTSIHWHGLHQRDSPYMDGVSMVTQCPIPAHTHFTYRFNASTPGTHFWHAHTGLQRTDGVFGPFIIRQTPAHEVHAGSYDFDLPEHSMIVNDWLVQMVAARFAHKHHGMGDNKPRAMLVNGKGKLDPVTNKAGQEAFTPREEFTVQPNGRYRFRVMSNGILNCPIKISIDNHMISIIATDGTPVEPMQVDSFNIFAGERYDFILTADQPVNNYWIKVRGLADCDEKFKHAKTNAILRYQGAPLEQPTQPPHGPPIRNHGASEMTLNPFNHRGNKHLLPVTKLTSLAPNDVTLTQEVPDKRFYIGMDFYYVDNPRFHNPRFYPTAGSKILQDSPQMNHISLLLPSSPPLSQPGDVPQSVYCNEDNVGKNCTAEYCECVHKLHVNLGDVVEAVLVDEGVPWDASHPTHLHGHAFRVVAMDRLGSKTTLQAVKEMDARGEIKRNLRSPVLKDSVSVPDGGYTVLRFHANNPGVWLLHCHIEYHAEIGMGLIIQVGGLKDFPSPPPRFPTCGNWDYPEEEEEHSLEAEQKHSVDVRGAKSAARVIGMSVGVAVLCYCVSTFL